MPAGGEAGALNVVPLFPGADGDVQAVNEDGSEDVPRAVVPEAAPAWNISDTSKLEDAGVAPFGPPKPVRETVHGNDNRVQIRDVSRFPWRASASLVITAKDGSQWVGTGWFIGTRVLATAGYCVCIKNSGVPGRDGWAKSIHVIPGRDGQNAPFGAATSTVFWSVTGWVDSGDENYDYAAVVIPTDLGQRTGWFGFQAADDTDLKKCMGNLAGYLADKGSSTVWYDSHLIASTSAAKVFTATERLNWYCRKTRAARPQR